MRWFSLSDGIDPIIAKHRKTEFAVSPLFVNRWSSRAFDDSRIEKELLFSLFEAARWAPSAYNDQPWRFLYSLRDDSRWSDFLGLLGQFNHSWCQRASALIVVAAHKNFSQSGKPNSHAWFDCGAAVQNFCLQATTVGLNTHVMAGFDAASSKGVLNIPDGFDAVVMVAVGRRGNPVVLPHMLRARELPSGRLDFDSFVSCGGFSW